VDCVCTQDRKLNDQSEVTTTNVQQDQTDAIKMAWAFVTDEGQQTDHKCSPLESNREKFKRMTEQKVG